MLEPRKPFDATSAAAVVCQLTESCGRDWVRLVRGPRWSPLRLDGHGAYRGADRLVLAASALSAGSGRRRWADVACLVEVGLMPLGGELPTVLACGRVLYGDWQLVATGDVGRHLLHAPEPLSVGSVRDAIQLLATEGGVMCTWSGVRRPTYDEGTDTIRVPAAARWGTGADDLAGLVETMVDAVLADEDDVGEIVRDLAVSFALGDLCAPQYPGLCQVTAGHQVCDAAGVEDLLEAAERAEEVCRKVLGRALDGVACETEHAIGHETRAIEAACDLPQTPQAEEREPRRKASASYTFGRIARSMRRSSHALSDP